MSEISKPRPGGESDLIARVRAAARQEQFLEVVSADEARARFERHLDLKPLAAETVSLADARERVLAQDGAETLGQRQRLDGEAGKVLPDERLGLGGCQHGRGSRGTPGRAGPGGAGAAAAGITSSTFP